MFKIKSWPSYQSYKDRKPPWIRFHKSLLDNFQFQNMSSNARSFLPMLWLLASEHEDPKSGIVKYSTKEISFRLRLTVKEIEFAVRECLDNDFITEIGVRNEPVTKAYINSPNSVTPETETETETETNMSGNEPDITPGRDFLEEAKEIIAFLNRKTGRVYEAVPANVGLVVARLKEGATFQQCKQVIARKAGEWLADEKMAAYLRPKTLFNKTNFAQYKGELVKPQEVSDAAVSKL